MLDDDYRTRKAGRKRRYETQVHGWKLVRCIACDGSGRYDNNGSPKCGACGGTGKTRVSPKEFELLKDIL